MMPNMITGESNVPIVVAQSTATNHLANTAPNHASRSEHQRFRMSISGEILEILLETDSTTTPTPTPTPEFRHENRKRTMKDKRKAKNN